MVSVQDDMAATVQETSQYISHEASKLSLMYEVGNIINEFFMSSMWNI